MALAKIYREEAVDKHELHPPRPWWIWGRAKFFYFALLFVVLAVFFVWVDMRFAAQSSAVVTILCANVPLAAVVAALINWIVIRTLVTILEHQLWVRELKISYPGLLPVLVSGGFYLLLMAVTFWISVNWSNQSAEMAMLASVCCTPVLAGVFVLLGWVLFQFRIRP
ncbi:hypothetical protein KBD71_00460 [Candidatus Woesebacteria bacterium]|nr:hypothetical protein [Candidatus Woesebacteria bacterium]